MNRIKRTLRLRAEGFAWIAAWRIAGLRLAQERLWGRP